MIRLLKFERGSVVFLFVELGFSFDCDVELGFSFDCEDMCRYYDQKARDPEKSRQVALRAPGSGQRLLKKYKLLGWSAPQTSLETVSARREKQIAFRKMQQEKLAAGMQNNQVNMRWFRR